MPQRPTRWLRLRCRTKMQPSSSSTPSELGGPGPGLGVLGFRALGSSGTHKKRDYSRSHENVWGGLGRGN